VTTECLYTNRNILYWKNEGSGDGREGGRCGGCGTMIIILVLCFDGVKCMKVVVR
jgi:hypothetical protein